MGLSESWGIVLRLTAYSPNLRQYGCSNQTSRIRETLDETVRKRSRVHAWFFGNRYEADQYFVIFDICLQDWRGDNNEILHKRKLRKTSGNG